MNEETQFLNWYDIPWPIQGHDPHFAMPHDVYDELVREYPNIDVEAELNHAFNYMQQRFEYETDEDNFTRFITNWMEKNERTARRKKRWFGGSQ
ncbi:hypothetical protein [Endozoicomonas atrinae]|uniref:hypothetical protein n=1 Tax=Endozoicomonas atrinae TaxID=1333660 RepID=UPI000826CDEA|nr:hypothetical protein [Endozoicomonas atrinae]